MIRANTLQDRRSLSRAGFTLVELLVVIAIILVLISLTAAGALQVMAYQRGNVSSMTLKVLSDSLDRQWRMVVDKASKEALNINQSTNPGIYFLANDGCSTNNQNVDKRARLIYIKLRLKQEFPMNFSEAIYPFRLPLALDPIILSNTPPGVIALAPPTFMNELLPHPSYGNLPPFVTYPPRGVLRNAKIYIPEVTETAGVFPPAFIPAKSATAASSSANPYGYPAESSACILMALQQGRGGPALTDDALGSGAVSTDPTTGLKYVVDAWGQPIAFYRWPTPLPNTNNSDNRDVDRSAPNLSAVFRDPLDPEGILTDSDWNNAANFTNRHGIWWFELLCHSVHEVNPNTSQYLQMSYYMVPTFVSSGRNNRIGLLQPIIPGAPYPSPFLPDPMTIDPSDPEGSFDNIWSYRLRAGNQGGG